MLGPPIAMRFTISSAAHTSRRKLLYCMYIIIIYIYIYIFQIVRILEVIIHISNNINGWGKIGKYHIKNNINGWGKIGKYHIKNKITSNKNAKI